MEDAYWRGMRRTCRISLHGLAGNSLLRRTQVHLVRRWLGAQVPERVDDVRDLQARQAVRCHPRGRRHSGDGSSSALLV